MSQVMQGPPPYTDVQVTFPNRSCHLVGDEVYAIPNYRFNGTGIERTGDFATIFFIRGHKDNDKRQEGVKTEDVVAMLIERQERLSGEVPDPRSQAVIMHLQAAKALLDQRTIDRTTRAVINTAKS